MLYRVRLDLILKDDQETLARNIYDALFNQLKDHAQVINKGLVNEEKSTLKLELCRHDENLPCVILKEVSK